MARIFITGSADGLGQLAARWLVDRNHHVVLHARDERRAREAQCGVPGAEGVLVGDLATLRHPHRKHAGPVSTDDGATVSGRYLHHKREARHHPAADDTALQDELLAACARITGVQLPTDQQ